MRHTLYKTVFLLVLAVGLAGCANPQAMRITPPAQPLAAGEGSAEFLDRISSQNRVSEDEALHGVLLLLDGEDPCENFEQRVHKLAQRKIVSSNWSYNGDEAITRGKLAYIIYQACNLSGGVTVTVTGPSQRYCMRELQYQNIMVAGAFYYPVDGMEFVAVLTRADALLETGEVPQVLAASK